MIDPALAAELRLPMDGSIQLVGVDSRSQASLAKVDLLAAGSHAVAGQIVEVHNLERMQDKLLKKINLELVEAAGVEPDDLIETAQLTDSENTRIGTNAMNAKSTVRSFPRLPSTPKLHLRTASFNEKAF
jgi:hypothetical protein